MRLSILAAALAAASLAAPAPALANHHLEAGAALASVLEHERRAGDRARDQYRHPAETLAFFQVEPGMTVVDYMPSTGWYSRILIPYLGSAGTYIGINPEIDEAATGYFATLRGTAEKLPGEARGWTGGEGAQVIGANIGAVPETLDGTVDRFLIFREMHNLRRFGWLHDSLVTARRLLKQDGLLGIVQHRAKPDAPADFVLGDKGYQREEDVIGLMSAYGFELVDRSEINANPRDPANWENGVWMLPPNYRGTQETDTARRAELDAIGESDRMTLLFRKRG